MRLEDEIKQAKPFKDEFQKLALNIIYTSGWLNCLTSRQLKPFDLTPQQFNVLRILRGNYPGTYCNQEITERMMDKSSNASRIVDKLLQKKLIERKENITDRRLVDIKITEKGLELLKEIDSSFSEMKKIFNNLTQEQARQMNEWLDLLRS